MMKMTKKNVSSRGRSRTDTGAQTAAVWLITALSPNVYDDRWWMPRVARFGSGSGRAGSTIATSTCIHWPTQTALTTSMAHWAMVLGEYTNGYFAHGVGPTTAKARVGWMERLVRADVEPLVPGRRPVAYCMERHDMILAKLVRGEQRDVDYARVAVRAGLVNAAVLQTRIDDLPVDAAVRSHVKSIVLGLVAK